MSEAIWAATIVLVVAAISAAGAYSCTVTNNNYYTAMNRCTDAKGSWVPTHSGIADAMCIYPH